MGLCGSRDGRSNRKSQCEDTIPSVGIWNARRPRQPTAAPMRQQVRTQTQASPPAAQWAVQRQTADSQDSDRTTLTLRPSASLSAQHPTTTAQEWVCPWVRPTTSEGKRAQRVPCATATMSGERTPARLRLHQLRTQGECQRKAEYMVIGLPRKADGKSHCSDEKAATFVRLHGGRPRLTTDSIRTPAGLLRRGSSLYKNEAMLPPKKIPLTLWRNEYGCFSENAIALKCFERN